MSRSPPTELSVKTITISQRHEGQRLDNFLIRELKGVPRSRVYRLIRKGEVRVNKKRCKPEFKLCVGDKLRVPPVRVSSSILKSGRVSRVLVELFLKNILHETKEFLIIIKRTSENSIYVAAIKAIFSIEKPLSINNPKSAVPNAVENTIKAEVKALIEPINFTP